MPSAAPSYCIGSPTCPNLGTYKGRCKEHARVQERTRYNADMRKLYSTPMWRGLRLRVLAEQPICNDCQVGASTECDHIKPHRGDPALFWDRANLQGLCTFCHGVKTQRGQ